MGNDIVRIRNVCDGPKSFVIQGGGIGEEVTFLPDEVVELTANEWQALNVKHNNRPIELIAEGVLRFERDEGQGMPTTKWTIGQLKNFADANGIQYAKNATKAKVFDAIQNFFNGGDNAADEGDADDDD